MNILGLNGQFKHDASACIVQDGRLIAFAEEERHCKVKHADGEIPIRSLLSCLSQTGLTINDIDIIAADWVWRANDKDIIQDLLIHPAITCRKSIPVEYFEHHLSHAASGYFTSGMDKAVVIAADGEGDQISTAVYYGEGNQLKEILTLDIPQSLGYFYTAIGVYLGLRMFDEGKTMGLASYGNPVYPFPIRLTDDAYRLQINPKFQSKARLNQITRQWVYYLTKKYGTPYVRPPQLNQMTGYIGTAPIPYDQRAKNLAASAQKALEDVLLHLVRVYTQKCNCRNVVMAGGVALNCSANGAIQQSGLVDELYILPAPNDGGNCIGAAMLACSRHMTVPCQKLPTPYWGHSFSNAEIQALLDKRHLRYEYVPDIEDRAAALLADHQIIGWFQGPSEMGPRALGNRSIVANPTRRENFLRVNKEVKYREEWRPLAPSILNEDRDFLLENSCYSPYMLKAFTVQEDARDKVPAIVHVDNSTRPQTVRQEDNPRWYKLIRRFRDRTGIPLVLNTSLNVQGQPMCYSPSDALHTFFSSGLDHLVLGNFLLSKN